MRLGKYAPTHMEKQRAVSLLASLKGGYRLAQETRRIKYLEEQTGYDYRHEAGPPAPSSGVYEALAITLGAHAGTSLLPYVKGSPILSVFYAYSSVSDGMPKVFLQSRKFRKGDDEEALMILYGLRDEDQLIGQTGRGYWR